MVRRKPTYKNHNGIASKIAFGGSGFFMVELQTMPELCPQIIF
jgi:hypothetical protein